MNKPLLTILLLGPSQSVGCATKDTQGESYELSEIENPGESLNELSDDETDGSDDDEDDTGDGDEPDDEPEGPVIDRRTFAQKLVVSMLMPGVFAPSSFEETSTTSYLLVNWEREGTEVTWTEELCHIRSTEAHGTQTGFPAAFVSTMPIRENRATLSAEEVGADFTVSSFVNVDGAELSSPASESLPTSANDGRLRDQDSDGNPGVTIHIDAPFGVSGNVYLAQRSTYAFEGYVIAQDRVEAYVTYDQDQSIIDASNPVLTVAEVVPVPNPERTTSYVLFQQVDDDTDCSDIKRENDDLF